ncbi:TonB-dependent receptor [Duganella sp. sic0402]|uniref:TonB-dependent siderophore receptor n=1 Tax=Duganella sp. sic0402 TaxID=2854786 RepID=UPI001C47C9DF|nr:TonB-dependent receptor [Duganella sp. sic0402]MBV7537514.1 TonB-dependent receptor [Duganella sp. sic0402]
MTRFRFQPAPLALAVALAFAAAGAHAQSGATPSAAVAVDIRINAQPLAPALDALARQTRLELIVQPALVAGKSAPAVQGRMTARDALQMLLQGSGLVADIDGTVVTVRASRREDAAMQTLAPVSVSAQALLSPTTEGTGSYTTGAVSIGKGEQALKDIPQSISVVTRQLLDEQNLTTLYDTLASTTGVTIQQSPQGGKYIYSRGFDLTTVQYDGVPLNRGMYGRASNLSAGTVIYDRVEVLRGAAGLLQGAGNPGGAVNLVRKRPLLSDATSVVAKAGSWDSYGVQLDASRVLNEQGTLRARVVADYEDKHAFIDYVDRRSPTLFATVEYDVTPQTQLNLALSSEEVRGTPFLNGLPRYSTGKDLGLPRSTFLGAAWNRQDNSNRGIFADLTHYFNDDWTLKVSTAFVKENNDMMYAGSGVAINPATNRGALRASNTLAENKLSGMDANVTGKFDALGRRHEVVAGVTYSYAEARTTYGVSSNYYTYDINSFNADFPEPTADFIYANLKEARVGKSRELGAYSALRLQLSDPLKLIIGGRLGWSRTIWDTVTTGRSPSVSTTNQGEHARLAPYAGLVYAINPGWNAYASYADIFSPQYEQKESGASLKPLVGANYEVGVKGALLDGRLNTSLALFRVVQENRAQEDYSTSPTCRSDYYCYTDSGKVRSQGLDAEISGELAKRWNIFAGYTFNRTKYLEDVNSGGLSFNSFTPKHMLRLWTTYQPQGALHDFTFGGGVNSQSASYRMIGTLTADVSGRAVWNSMIKYQINPRWSASLNFNNMFDKRYYSTLSSFVNANYYGDPRNVTLTLRGGF